MTAQKEVLIWKRFECAFPESKYWHGPKRGYGAGDNGNRYMRLQYASGASIYFPLSVNHAHIVPRSVRTSARGRKNSSGVWTRIRFLRKV